MLRRLSLGLLASAISVAAPPAIAQEDGSADDLGVDNAAVIAVISEISVSEGIKEPNAGLTNRERQEPTNACLVRRSSTLQCALKTKGGFNDILKADAHHTKVISTAVFLRNGRQRSNGDGRSQQSNRETAEHGSGVSPRMMPSFDWLRR